MAMAPPWHHVFADDAESIQPSRSKKDQLTRRLELLEVEELCWTHALGGLTLRYSKLAPG